MQPEAEDFALKGSDPKKNSTAPAAEGAPACAAAPCAASAAPREVTPPPAAASPLELFVCRVPPNRRVVECRADPCGRAGPLLVVRVRRYGLKLGARLRALPEGDGTYREVL